MDDNLLRMILNLYRRLERFEADEGSGVSRNFGESTEVSGMSADGEVVQEVRRTIVPLDCGHSAASSTPVGKCGVCSGWVCAECFSQCHLCGVPLCRAHRREFQGLRLCEECLEMAKAKARWEKVRSFIFGRTEE